MHWNMAGAEPMYTTFPLFVLAEKPEPEMITRVPPANEPLSFVC
jgi:hypothetical protein